MANRTPTVVQSVALSALRPGVKLPAPIYDARNPSVLLLGSGMRLSPDNLERLQSRGVTQVAIESQHLAEICTTPSEPEPQAAASEKSTPKFRYIHITIVFPTWKALKLESRQKEAKIRS